MASARTPSSLRGGIWDAAAVAMSHSIRTRVVGVNVPPIERVATALVGAGLVGVGLQLRRPRSALVTAVGALALVRAATGRCPAYRARTIRKGIHVRRVITVQASPREIYALWRDLTNLPRFLSHVEAVELEPGGVSRWTIRERGRRLEFRAQITEDTPGHRLRWETLPGGDLEHTGALELRKAPGDRGTEVEVKLHYVPRGGIVVASALYAILRRLARTQIGVELARLRQLLETGEIATGVHCIDDVDEREQAAIRIEALRSGAAPVATVVTAEASEWPAPGGAR